jgi:hypothetical protein
VPALQVLNLNGTRVENLNPVEGLPALLLLYLGPSVSEAERTEFRLARAEKRLPPVEIRH